MNAIMKFYVRAHAEEGQTLAEYALLLGLIAVVAIGAVTILGTNIQVVLNQIAAAV